MLSSVKSSTDLAHIYAWIGGLQSGHSVARKYVVISLQLAGRDAGFCISFQHQMEWE
jgi:hypothetical protein